MVNRKEKTPTEQQQQQKKTLKFGTRNKPYLNKVLGLGDTVLLTRQLHWHSLPGRLQEKKGNIKKKI